MSRATVQAKKIFSGLFDNRRKILTVLVITLLIPIFQNCSGSGFSTGSSGSSSNANSSSVGGGTDTSAGAGGTTTVDAGGTTMTLAQKQALCKAATSKPAITALPITEGSAKSGLGTTSSGDVNSTTFSLTADRGISDAATFASLGCESQYSLSLDCAVVSTDQANYPVSITNAFDASGNSLMSKTQAALASGAFSNANCSQAFTQNTNTITFSIRPNTKNERCVEGSFYLKLTVKNQVSGVTGTNVSDPKYFKVTMNNGCWNESRLKDSAGDLPAVANFGTTVAMSNGWAAVVAPTDDASASILDVGSVYMYMFDGTNWVQKQKIMINDAAAFDTLQSVAMNGDTMVLGSPYRNSRGMVFFFRKSGETWNLIQRVDPQDIQANQYFGQAIAVNGSYVFVGSPNYTASGLSKAGAVSIYSYSSAGMTYIKTLTGSVANIAFGSAIAADANLVAVGAPQAIGKETLGFGSVYVFDGTGGVFNQVAVQIGTSLAEKFGATVALLGGKLAVGSPNYTSGTKTNSGRVTFYNAYAGAVTKTWDGNEASANMGQGLALSSTGIYIGSPYSNARTGMVDHYLYSAIGTLYYRLLAYNGTANSAFGWSVAASGSDIVIGSRIKNDPNDNSGAAYIYRYK